MREEKSSGRICASRTCRSVSSPTATSRRNAQSRILLGEDYEHLDNAGITQRLDARYMLVGYTEAFDEFVFMLHMTEGLPLCQYGNRLVRAERQSYQPSADDLARVRQANVVDTRLHAPSTRRSSHASMPSQSSRARS